MLDLNRYYPPKYYIGDVYLKYLAEKKKKTDQPKDYSSFEWTKAFQSKASDISKPEIKESGGSSYELLYVLLYDL